MSRLIRLSVIVVILSIVAACVPQDEPATPAPTAAPTLEATEAQPQTDSTLEVSAPEIINAAPETDSTPEASDAATTEAPGVESTPEGAGAIAEPAVRIDQDNTVLRSGPGTSYSEVTTVRAGAILPVTGKSGEGLRLWYQVTLPDGATAWAWGRVAFLQPEGADVPVVEAPPAS